jgi:hypothetical protein
MSHRRLVFAALAGSVVAAIAAAPVAAGGSATIEVTAGLDEPPVAGEERELRVLVLQHGVTPVDFGTVIVTATRAGSGESVTAQATSLGAGTWAASLAFPEAGPWQVRVVHDELAMPAPISVTVASSGIDLPAAAPIVGLAALVLVLALVVALGRRPRSSTPAAPVEPSLRGG